MCMTSHQALDLAPIHNNATWYQMCIEYILQPNPDGLVALVQFNGAADLGIGIGISLQSSVKTTVSRKLPSNPKD